MGQQTIRVCSSHKAAADVINGITFASLDGVKISERLTRDQADEFLKNPGVFQPWDGKDDSVVERALDSCRATKAAALVRVQDDAKVKLAESQAAHRATMTELASCTARIAELEKRPSDAELRAAHEQLTARHTEVEQIAATRAQRIGELEAQVISLQAQLAKPADAKPAEEKQPAKK